MPNTATKRRTASRGRAGTPGRNDLAARNEDRILQAAAEIAEAGEYPSSRAIARRLGVDAEAVRRVRTRLHGRGRWPHPLDPPARFGAADMARAFRLVEQNPRTPIAQLARHMGVPEGTFRSWLRRRSLADGTTKPTRKNGRPPESDTETAYRAAVADLGATFGELAKAAGVCTRTFLARVRRHCDRAGEAFPHRRSKSKPVTPKREPTRVMETAYRMAVAEPEATFGDLGARIGVSADCFRGRCRQHCDLTGDPFPRRVTPPRPEPPPAVTPDDMAAETAERARLAALADDEIHGNPWRSNTGVHHAPATAGIVRAEDEGRAELCDRWVAEFRKLRRRWRTATAEVYRAKARPQRKEAVA